MSRAHVSSTVHVAPPCHSKALPTRLLQRVLCVHPSAPTTPSPCPVCSCKRLVWKFGGHTLPPHLQRVLALSPPRVGRLPSALLRTTCDAAPSPARLARFVRAAVAVEVLHRLPPPLASQAKGRVTGRWVQRSCLPTAAALPESKKWDCTEVASLLSRATDVPTWKQRLR